MLVQHLVLEYGGKDFQKAVNKLLAVGWVIPSHFTIITNEEDGTYITILEKERDY